MLNKALEGGLYIAEAALRTPYVDFRWNMKDHQAAFDKLDKFREDGKLTDEELGDVVGTLGESMPRGVKAACWAVEGLLKSRYIDFEWTVEEHQAVFDQIEKMRENDHFEDEELADLLKVIRETLSA